MKGLLTYSMFACVALAGKAKREEGDDCEVKFITVYGKAPTSTLSAGGEYTGSTHGSNADIGHHVVNHNHGAHHVYSSFTAAQSTGRHEDSIGHAEASRSSAVHPTSASNISGGASSTSAAASGSSPSADSSTDESSALSLPKRPDGQPALPINDDHIKAPVAKDTVPKTAVMYKPSKPGVFDCKDFETWMGKQKANPPEGKWMKVEPGSYRFALGPVMPAGTDANTVTGENIAIGFMPGGWTLDLRGVTFIIDITPENQNQRPGVIIYINQSEDFTLLGGTVWVDQGELWSQARVTSLGAVDGNGNQAATIEVEKGYNTSVWKTGTARNQFCVDDSDPNHYTRPGCNFWKVDNYDYSELESSRTFKASLMGGSNISKGTVLTMQNGPQSLFTISTENNGNFQVKGFTTNGGFMSIGLNGKVAPKVSDYYYVNPPPRPGFAPRVQGPALNWGNIAGFDYVPPGQASTDFSNSFWQYTGCPKDLFEGSDDGKKPEGL